MTNYFLEVFLWVAAFQGLILMVFLMVIRKVTPPGQKETIPVSVVVCARNEAVNLQELIPQLLAQEYPDFEIIIVDDRSSDETYDQILEWSQSDSRLKVVHVGNVPDHIDPKKYAITLGIKKALNDVVLFTDADCRPSSVHWISGMSSFFTRPQTQIVIGYSPYINEGGILGNFICFETLVTGLQYLGFARMGMPYMGVGRNLAYRKSFFLAQKGFHGFQHLTGGDDDLFVNRNSTAVNTRCCIYREAVTYSYPAKGWSGFFRQKVRHLAAGKSYRLIHRIILGIFLISYLLTWIIGISLLYLLGNSMLVFCVLIARTLIFTIVCWRFSRVLGDRTTVVLIPFLDFVYLIYYLSTAPVAFFVQKVRWKS